MFNFMKYEELVKENIRLKRLLSETVKKYEAKIRIADALNNYANTRLLEVEAELKHYQSLHQCERYRAPWED